jgi:hypothetical protein
MRILSILLSAPQIIQTTAQTAAVIHLMIPRREMMKMFGPAVDELTAALAAQGVEPIGFRASSQNEPGRLRF